MELDGVRDSTIMHPQIDERGDVPTESRTRIHQRMSAGHQENRMHISKAKPFVTTSSPGELIPRH